MGRTAKVQATPVYERLSDAIAAEFKIILLEGGSRSSKTYSVAQKLIEETMNGALITVTRQRMTWLKDTVLMDFSRIVKANGYPISPVFNKNRDNQEYQINGAGSMAFIGADEPQKLHGRPQDIFWGNEAMELSHSCFDQLEMRTNRYGILDYNPIATEHWIFDRVARRPDATLIHSTMLDNPFLPDTIIKKILSYEPTDANLAAGTADLYMWQVYGLGLRAKLKGLVFENARQIDAVPEEARLINRGLDFGFSNHPTALVAVYLWNKSIILDQEIYETGMTNQDICVRLRLLGVARSDEIVGDSAEPKSIEEINREGFNVIPADKGPDSIVFGIDLMKQFPLLVTKQSADLWKEFQKYKWAQDRSGKQLNRPVDEFNHGIDCSRYAIVRKFAAQNQGRKAYGVATVS